MKTGPYSGLAVRMSAILTEKLIDSHSQRSTIVPIKA
jgi:hypothetical protein